MIVDAHVHVISNDQQKYPRKAGELPEWVQDLSAASLIELNRESGIDRTILVQGFGPYQYDNSYAADCAAEYPDHFACVCIVDPLQTDAAEKLTYWVKRRGARGVRLFTTVAPEIMLNDPRLVPLWQQAADLAIPICILMRFPQVARLPALLERFANVPVALDHVALPRLREGFPYAALQPLFELARFPNLYLKFSSETIYAARRGRSTQPPTISISKSSLPWPAKNSPFCPTKTSVGVLGARHWRYGPCHGSGGVSFSCVDTGPRMGHGS
jgi:L-fuconolactonase